jgi:uncharacterized protein DUF4352
VLATACGGESVGMSATAPFSYPALIDGSLRRYAVPVTVVNHGDGSLLVSPTEFQARDRDRHVYRADPVATAGDAALVRRVAGPLGMSGLTALPTVNLQKNDVVSGFVVFEVPFGVQLSQLVFREGDNDHVTELPAPR